MTGLVLRLAGPLQAWGEHGAFDYRDTATFPTRSGLIGLLACCLGLPRGHDLDRLRALRFTIRVDQPGTTIVDYHTTGGGRLRSGQRVPTADGKGRGTSKGTIQTWRSYLSDAVFIVAITAEDPEVIADLATALGTPRWQPYLGRRSCPPTQPMLLSHTSTDPVAELHTTVPLARPHHGKAETVEVLFHSDHGHPDTARTTVHDEPTRFTTYDRTYGFRPQWSATHPVPASLCATGDAYDTALARYVTSSRTTS